MIEPEDLFINFYEHCDTHWQIYADSQCNDRCPICDKEIEPYASRDCED